MQKFVESLYIQYLMTLYIDYKHSSIFRNGELFGVLNVYQSLYEHVPTIINPALVKVWFDNTISPIISGPQLLELWRTEIKGLL